MIGGRVVGHGSFAMTCAGMKGNVLWALVSVKGNDCAQCAISLWTMCQ